MLHGLWILVLALWCLGATAAAPDYGSYVCICDAASANVTFVNFPERDCAGTPTIFQEPLNACFKELVFFSWNGFCNATTMWYQNFKDTACTGVSVVSRVYRTYQCMNCENPECKNGPDNSTRF